MSKIHRTAQDSPPGMLGGREPSFSTVVDHNRSTEFHERGTFEISFRNSVLELLRVVDGFFEVVPDRLDIWRWIGVSIGVLGERCIYASVLSKVSEYFCIFKYYSVRRCR